MQSRAMQSAVAHNPTHGPPMDSPPRSLIWLSERPWSAVLWPQPSTYNTSGARRMRSCRQLKRRELLQTDLMWFVHQGLRLPD
eukprot:458114-Amphidinium_carterae.1